MVYLSKSRKRSFSLLVDVEIESRQYETAGFDG